MKRKNIKRASIFSHSRPLRIAGIFIMIGITIGADWIKDDNTTLSKQDTVKYTPYKTDTLLLKNTIATILDTKIICKEPGKYLGDGSEYTINPNGHFIIAKRVIEQDRYMAWGTLAKTKEGELIVTFSGDRDSHICPWGKTQIVRSRDLGKTWSEPQTINNTPLDDRDAGIIQTNKGTLVVSWFTSVAFSDPKHSKVSFERYARYSEKITQDIKDKWLGNWVRRSEDGGKTWLEPVRTVSSCPHGPIQLRDGRLLFVGTGKKFDVIVEQSSDDGRSWNVLATLPQFDDPISEPHVVELASGKLIAMIRHEPKDRTQCFLLQTESIDGGKTWSPFRKTNIWGYPPHLLQLKNGWLLASYGFRMKPYSERACISRDEGKTWDIENESILSSAPGADCGYPSSVQLDDGSILTVYYQADSVGRPTSMMSTHWRLK